MHVPKGPRFVPRDDEPKPDGQDQAWAIAPRRSQWGEIEAPSSQLRRSRRDVASA